jgi:hypothetical protein
VGLAVRIKVGALVGEVVVVVGDEVGGRDPSIVMGPVEGAYVGLVGQT